MEYCPPNITISEVWIDHGISHCFMDTVISAVTCGFMLVFGTGQIIAYKKFATSNSLLSKPRSLLFYTQVLLHMFLQLLSLLKLLLHGVWLEGSIYGYMVFATCCNLVMWSLALLVVLFERNYQLPSIPTQGHGLILLTFWTLVFVGENLAFLNLKKDGWWSDITSITNKMELTFFVLRYSATCLVFLIGLKAPGISKHRDYYSDHSSLYDAEQREPLLTVGERTETASQGSTWKDVVKKLRTLLPFIWPHRDIFLQLRVIICFCLLIIGRVANVYVPLYSKVIVDSLTPTDNGSPIVFRWDYILIFVGIKFVQGGGTGGMGLLNNIRSLLWIRVQQYTTREVQVNLFSHLHSLSLRWHLGRKTGEVLRVMDRGTTSINSLLSYLTFNILPTIADIVIAVAYFASYFNGWFGLIVFVTMMLYLFGTVVVTEWRTKYRRSMNLTDNEQRARGVDSLLNFETVKYYGAEEYEVRRYKSAIVSYQHEEWKSTASLTFLNMVQNVVINVGLLAGSLYCALLVTRKQLSVGDYVLYGTYILQLYMPLNWLGTYYRMIQQSFIDMENMLDLLQEQQEVKDIPNAPALKVKRGQIQFRNVSFSYTPEMPILQNISFTVQPGKTVALVGPSGSGKSTIIRLLFRFYDVTEGEILLDGDNVREVSQSSVRQVIGVVPQDTVLFNDTIMYNIQYGRIESIEEEVIEAAKHADIHSKIEGFPDGYNTKVGERGLKLSGGEKQRVAIARTILKDPTFILLDEATSALDTQTERRIQKSLNKICKDRTTVIVAHRLSTIIHADVILVLKAGEIVERGRHEELLSRGGMYANMWQQQLKIERKRRQKEIAHESIEEEPEETESGVSDASEGADVNNSASKDGTEN